MPGHRVSLVLDRNVHFVNAHNDEIGGLYQNGSVTWAEISDWMQIVYLLPFDQYATFPCLENDNPEDPAGQHGEPIDMQANHPVQPGYYVILSPEGLPIEIPINEVNPIPRAVTRSLSRMDPHVSSLSFFLFRENVISHYQQSEKFRHRVRERDRRCVITGEQSTQFLGLQAAHIFPLAHLDMVLGHRLHERPIYANPSLQWRLWSWQQHITDDAYDCETGIHSVQNGILLDLTAHAYFDKYMLAINPDVCTIFS